MQSPVPASADLPGAQEWADAFGLAAGEVPGGRATPLMISMRPTGLIGYRESQRSPIRVHWDAAVGEAQALVVLEALESAQDFLAAQGWPLPVLDGGAGGSASADFYLVADAAWEPRVAYDGLVAWTAADHGSAFVTWDPRGRGDAVAACATAAFGMAALGGTDPAEAVGWIRGSAAYLAWLVHGRWGCSDEDEGALLGRSFTQTPVSLAGDDAAAGALWMRDITRRSGGEDGRFWRDLWMLTQQHTRDAALGLRRSPQLWEALDVVLKRSATTLDRVAHDVAVDRSLRWAKFGGCVTSGDRPLPIYTGIVDSVDSLGSACWVVGLAAPDAAQVLRLWMRGEYGVRWAASAVRVDDSWSEVGRISAPVDATGKGYWVMEPDGRGSRLVLVATNLSSRLPNALLADENTRGARWVLDRAGALTAPP